MKNNFLFAIFPYIAFGLLAAGTLVRYLLFRKQKEVMAAEIAEARAVFSGNRLWRISLVFLLVGHGIALLAPRMLLSWNHSSLRLSMLEAAFFVIGCAALAGWLVVLWRNLKHHHGSPLNELSDVVLLGLIFVAITSGLLVAVLYRWGSSWGTMTLTPYFISVLKGNPSAKFVVQLPFLVRLHVFSLFASLAVLPATRIGTVVAAVLRGVLVIAGKLAAAAARAGEALGKKLNPAPWLWPEED